MKSLYITGTHGDRAVKSQRITQMLQTQRRKVVEVKTYDMMRDFEEHLKTFQKSVIEDVEDNLPLNATASTLREHERTQLHRSTVITTLDTRSDSSDSPRTPHNKRFMQKSYSDTHITSHLDQLEDGDQLHAQRPPSPLAHYDYGIINLKARSTLTQQQRSSASQDKSTRRPSSGCGFYFPGPDYKQGPYGSSMQDPILLPRCSWERSRGPEGSDQQRNNVRPRTTKDSGNDGGIRQAHITKPTVSDIVRSTRGHDTKAERVFQNLDRVREEAGLEHEKFEEGTFGGRWCHPVRPKKEHLTKENVEPHRWMEQELNNAGEADLMASRILAGITRKLQEHHSTVPRLFKPVNIHSQAHGELELEDFIDGLMRLHILEDDEPVTLKVLSEAMSLIDPHFDGRVNYPALQRAVKAAQLVQRKPTRPRSGIAPRGSKATSTIYGAELPHEVVKVDMNSRSVYDFNTSKDLFAKQQRALLVEHGIRVDGT